MLYRFDQLAARKWWIRSQCLHSAEPFGDGPSATSTAVEHLGYVQIDTINVIERSHHHILFSRIPKYKKSDLHQSQTIDRSVFEYWTHALSYVPTRDLKFYLPSMQRSKKSVNPYFKSVDPSEYKKLLTRIQKEGSISIRDIKDEKLVEKNHPWASRKPSKKALQFGFYSGDLVISERQGMLKKYELAHRHFPNFKEISPATDEEIHEYLLSRALRSQGFVSLDSVCYLNASAKPKILRLIQKKVEEKKLIQFQLNSDSKNIYWTTSEVIECKSHRESNRAIILSPFDPLVIQRKRLKDIFNYDHRFEAYLPKEKRKYGYFSLPILFRNNIVALLDLKADRQKQQLLIQQWTWLPKSKTTEANQSIEKALERFEKFQLADID